MITRTYHYYAESHLEDGRTFTASGWVQLTGWLPNAVEIYRAVKEKAELDGCPKNQVIIKRIARI